MIYLDCMLTVRPKTTGLGWWLEECCAADRVELGISVGNGWRYDLLVLFLFLDHSPIMFDRAEDGRLAIYTPDSLNHPT